MIKNITVALMLTGSLSVFSQSKEGDNYFKFANFDQALEEYLEVINDNEDDLDLNYKIAVCYLNTNIDKSLAYPYLEKVIENPKHGPDAEFLLGRAYHFAYRFDDAIKYYEMFLKKGKGSPDNLFATPRLIEQCANAKEIMKFPVDVTFVNLGKEINSLYDDYFPFVPTNESYIVFNSKREENNNVQKDNGIYFANTFISKVVEGKYQEAEFTKGINEAKTDNEVVGLSPAGDKIVFYKESFRGLGDLHMANFSEEGEATNDKVLGETINSKYTEIAGCLSADGKKFYFASDREGGYGGIDIYVCQILPNGEWSEAMNLGPTINTEYDEDFPNIFNEGKDLYFSSNGHSSMGGYDIFKAKWDEEKKKFEQVTNLGYPINTPEDNMNFRISDDGKYGYIAALRKEGFGGLDIYRINFNTVEPKYTVIRGGVYAENNAQLEKVNITIFDEEGEIYGDYRPNPKTMKYVIILPAGNYTMEVESPGYEIIEQQVYVKDKASYKPEIARDIHLKK